MGGRDERGSRCAWLMSGHTECAWLVPGEDSVMEEGLGPENN